ncbi:MAG: dihydropteroate synthase [Rhodobacteraceae bacterium]|nr:dihydropteroate synthase [Paracoccaceae bacterium]
MGVYYRPIPSVDPAFAHMGLPIAGGWARFTHIEVLRRDAAAEVVPIDALPDVAARLATAPVVAPLNLRRPVIMGILNVTPDSFSDGGDHAEAAAAVEHAQQMTAAGADIIDVGGESTRPGAVTVPVADEIQRTSPPIAAMRAAGIAQAVSIDTRKAPVAQAALDAGATIINDVSGFTYDPDLMQVARNSDVPVCVMHAQGDPATMQNDPTYDDVLLDVYDWLAGRIAALEAAGIAKSRIIADPGIGFGKTLHHNLALLRRISLFHGLGVPVLLGVSRKRFIGTIGQAPEAKDRAPGSIAVAQAALDQGIQIMRVHDVAETRQAVALWQALVASEGHE